MVVAEDDEGLCLVVCTWLERQGLTTLGVHSGADAIAAVQEHPDCLLLLDFTLPDMKGGKVIAELTAQGRPVPFIVMTGRGDERVAVEMMKLGARDYVVKDVDFTDRLVPIVERVLAQVATEEQLAASEMALRESEERNRLLVENSMDGVLLTTPDGRILAANREACRIFGRSEAEICRLGRSGVVDPTDPRLAPALAERERSGRFHSELTLARADGTKFPADVSSVVFTSRGGQLLTSMVVRDLTERQRAEKSLRESEERYRRIVETANEGVWTMDADCRTTYANPRLVEMLGCTVTDLLGRQTEDFMFPEDVAAHMERIARRRAGESGTYELRLQRKDGSECWTLVSGSPVLDAQGSYAGSFAMLSDISDRKQAEAALWEEKERAREYLNIAGVMLVALDVEGRIVLMNRRGNEILGYGEGELIGRSWFDTCIPERLRDEIKGVFSWLMVGAVEPVERYENPVVTRSGEERLVFWHNVVLRDQSGRRIGTLSSGEDVTDRRQAEETLRTSEAQLSNAMEIARLGYWEYDAVEDQFTFNNHFYSIFHATAEQVGGYKMSSAEYARRFVHPDDAELVGIETRKAIEAPDPHFNRQLEHRIIYADGGVGYISVRFFVVKDSQGRTVKTYGANQDITERKRAENELRNALDEIRRLKDRLEAENVYLRREIKLEHIHGDIVGESPAIKQTLALVEQVAPTGSTVLIQGETGTGKELLARSIHHLSPRKDRPLVTVSCAAMPSTLVESELFGHEKGAYTGALTRQAGRFEVADKSTLFLDEVGELPAEAQTKLLRVLQEGKFERLGSSNTVTVDVRVVAATNRDLEQAVKAGRFREDLFYRLNVFPITIPPLRERREDIPVLVWAFVREFNEKMGKRIESIPKQTLEALSDYPWPGNVRALRNTIERAMILSTGTTLRVELPGTRPGVAGPTRLDEAQRSHVAQVLESTNWRIRGKGGAAELLGLKPTTLEYRIKKLGIQRQTRDSG